MSRKESADSHNDEGELQLVRKDNLQHARKESRGALRRFSSAEADDIVLIRKESTRTLRRLSLLAPQKAVEALSKEDRAILINHLRTRLSPKSDVNVTHHRNHRWTLRAVLPMSILAAIYIAVYQSKNPHLHCRLESKLQIAYGVAAMIYLILGAMHLRPMRRTKATIARSFLQSLVLMDLWCALSYMCMALQWFVPMKGFNGQCFQFVHIWQWMGTCPLMIVIVSYLSAPRSISVCVAVVSVSCCQIAGFFSSSLPQPSNWISLSFSFAFFLVFMVHQCNSFFAAIQEAVLSDKAKLKGLLVCALMSWSSFPVLWGLWASETVSSEVMYVLLMCADFMAKAIYAKVLVATSIVTQVNYANHMTRWATRSDRTELEWNDVVGVLRGKQKGSSGKQKGSSQSQALKSYDSLSKLASVSGSDQDFQRFLQTQIAFAKEKEKMASQIERATIADAKRRQCVVDARTIMTWNFVMLLAIAFVAVFSPFEIAFLDFGEFGARFAINRTVDLIFLADIVMNFLVELGQTGHDRCQYLRGWFFLDLVSTIPFDLLSVAVGDTGAEWIMILIWLRMLRVFRLVKVMGAMQGSPTMVHWEAKLSLKYNSMSLCMYFFGFLILSHWLACLWAIPPQFEPHGSWLTNQGLDDAPVGQKYVACLYWSCMTMTTIGYGDIAPISTSEQLVALLGMVLGSAYYAYMVAGVTFLLQVRYAGQVSFHRSMDLLNEHMNEAKTDQKMRVQVRKYLIYTKQARAKMQFYDLMQQVSPGLRGKFVYSVHSWWLSKMDFLLCSDETERGHFVNKVANRLSACTFPAQEMIQLVQSTVQKLYIITKGLVAYKGRMLRRGHHFGHEIVCDAYPCPTNVCSFTYVDCLMLCKQDLDELRMSGAFPQTAKNLRKLQIRLLLRQAIMAVVEKRKKKQRDFSSGHCLSQSETTTVNGSIEPFPDQDEGAHMWSSFLAKLAQKGSSVTQLQHIHKDDLRELLVDFGFGPLGRGEITTRFMQLNQEMTASAPANA